MKKAELVKKVAEKAGVIFPVAKRVIDALEETVIELLKEGAEFKACHVNFSVEETGPRKARNPRTGEVIEVPARKTVKIKKSMTLKKLFKE